MSARAKGLVLLLFFGWIGFCAGGQGPVLDLPPRPTDAISGSEFVKRIASLDLPARENAIFEQVTSGNVPDFLRHFCPVHLAGVAGGRTNAATVYVIPDYLAIGSDADFFIAPMSPYTAQRLAYTLHCSLPTRKIVEAIFAAAEVKLIPAPIPPSPAMTGVQVFAAHNDLVRAQRNKFLAAHPLGALTAGDKKDVVLSPKLMDSPGKVAIYGWHKPDGPPIQPLFLGHTASWVDYSQCIRLLSEEMQVNGKPTTVSQVLTNPALAALLSDEGPFRQPCYPTNWPASANFPKTALPANHSVAEHFSGFAATGQFDEYTAELQLAGGVKARLNEPGQFRAAGKKLLLIFYALPNGATIEQTIGKAVKPGDDWHFDIQHIGAQTRFLRERIQDRAVVVAYLANTLKSWPAWRKQHGDAAIPGLLGAVESLFSGDDIEIVLSGHSGGGSLIFGYVNALDQIPNQIVRLAFLDADYAYDGGLGHERKIAQWLRASGRHFLCVLAYDDAAALLNGKPFVSAAGGTWGKSHEMEHDLAAEFNFARLAGAQFERFSALDGRIQFILKENPERRVFHTVQVERNGFIHSMLTGTKNEERGYQYFGPRAYTNWIQQR